MKKDENFLLKAARGILFSVTRFLMFIGFRTKITYVNFKGRKGRFNGPCIYICNHTDLCDGVLMDILFQYNGVHPLVAKDWFEKKKVNWFLRQGRCYPIDRRTHDFSWLMKSVRTLKGGESILIFPEGGISRTDTMKPFKPGFVMLALKAKVPVIPVATTEKYKVFGKRQHVIIGEPIYLSETVEKDNKSQYMKEKADFFRSTILELQSKYK